MSTIPVGAIVRDRELPELGPGRILAELQGGASRIVFEHNDEMRDVDLSRVDVVRLPLIPGTQVDVRVGDYGDEDFAPGEVVEAELPDSADELCDYVVDVEGEQRTVSEAELFPREPDSSAPRDQLGALFWRGPFRFFARWGMHRSISRLYEDSEGLPSLIGARLDPGVQHIRAVREALWSDELRFVLADPAARDRMLEAGMILQHVCSREPETNVLVVAPGVRTREWATQLELRFGGRDSVRLTESHLAGKEFPELTEMLDHDRIVVSADLLGRSRDLQTLLAESVDLLLVDGAHRLAPEGETHHFCRQLSETAEGVLALAPAPAEPDVGALASLFSLIRPDEYHPQDVVELENYVGGQMDLWQAARETRDALADEAYGQQSDELQETWQEAAEGAPSCQSYVDALDDGGEEAAEDLLAFVQRFHGFADRVVRTPRSALRETGVAWPGREVEIADYQPDEPEAELAEHVESIEMPDAPTQNQRALRVLYHQLLAETPKQFRSVLERRGEAIDEGRHEQPSVGGLVERILNQADPAEASGIWKTIVDHADPMPDEEAWLGGALGHVQDWDNACGGRPARLGAAAGWTEEFLDEDETHRVVAMANSRRVCETFHGALLENFGEGVAELDHSELPESLREDAVERFRHDDECRVLVVDELGAEGHGLEGADAIVHLDQPWSPEALNWRIARLERSGFDGDEFDPVISWVPRGPSETERRLIELYDEVLGIYDAQPDRAAGSFAELERVLFEQVGQQGAAGVEEVCETWRDREERESDDEARAFRSSFDPRPGQLEEVTDFTELLDFIDGMDNPLPVRHWARMIGIDDERVRAGVYDFKWHWSSVRRDLEGFDTPEGDDPSEWEDEQTVAYLSGTFSRQKALDDEGLEFFAPGHRLVDALVKDALGPTDGRATVFARRLGGAHRGKVYAVLVVRCELNESCWGDLEPTEGLIRRTHRRFWPESTSVMVEIDIQGEEPPSVVEDPELIQRLEESYEGPQADQKIEYEVLVRAIEDAKQFRQSLDEAVEIGLDDLRDQRDFLVDDAVDRLEDDFRRDIDYYESLAERADSDERREEAEREVELRERLIESVEDYSTTVDAIALVVGGTPEALLQ